MRYIFIEKCAIETLTENRFYQSAEFEQALDVVNFIRNQQEIEHPALTLKVEREVGYIFSANAVDLTKALIFDLCNFKGFDVKSDSHIITIIQMACRFVRRNWGNLRNSPKERYAENNHAVIFPFPLHSYRILLNLCPDSKFQDRKGVSYIVVTADGTSDKLNDVAVEIPCKKLREEALLICRPSYTRPDEKQSASSVLDVSSMDTIKGKSVNPNIGYESWMHLLTQNQKKFIEKDIIGAERLEGAAGTGKTLTLILKAIYNLKKHIKAGTSCNMIFFAHSEATKKQIESIFISNYPEIEQYKNRLYSSVSIEITTLQEWCAKTLNGRILPTEYLDSDAQTSKELQLMYLEEVLERCMKLDFPTYKLFCSQELINFFDTTEKETVLQMIQSEIAVTIKGRSNQDIETYKGLNRLEGSIPLKKEGDYNFIYLIYERYQESLTTAAAFDSDDIVLTALGQLTTPLWRRRRNTEGYDVIFIDETHLFNHNELSVFHYILRERSLNIVFAIDKTQAVGDRGVQISIPEFDVSIQSSTKYNTVFRSSPDIVNCAFHILRSGMTLFTTFENPLDCINYSFTVEEENKSPRPIYYLLENEERIIEEAFRLADSYRDEYKTCRHNILIVSTTSDLLDQLRRYAVKYNKPYECLTQRGDIETIKSAEEKNRFVIGLIDYIGGLEFDAVIIIGVDKDRVPPSSIGKDGYIFQNYAWHNRMYVAVSRAKYILAILGDKSRGESMLLRDAIYNNAIVVK